MPAVHPLLFELGPHAPTTRRVADLVREGGTAALSGAERRADEATREAIDWLKCEYMMDKVGQEFDGMISGVTNFGLFILLKDIYVEGLLHISNLDSDYYEYDSTQHRLRGQRSGKVYRMGDALRVLVAGVNLEKREIDFEPVN